MGEGGEGFFRHFTALRSLELGEPPGGGGGCSSRSRGSYRWGSSLCINLGAVAVDLACPTNVMDFSCRAAPALPRHHAEDWLSWEVGRDYAPLRAMPHLTRLGLNIVEDLAPNLDPLLSLTQASSAQAPLLRPGRRCGCARHARAAALGSTPLRSALAPPHSARLRAQAPRGSSSARWPGSDAHLPGPALRLSHAHAAGHCAPCLCCRCGSCRCRVCMASAPASPGSPTWPCWICSRWMGVSWRAAQLRRTKRVGAQSTASPLPPTRFWLASAPCCHAGDQAPWAAWKVGSLTELRWCGNLSFEEGSQQPVQLPRLVALEIE